MPSETSKAIVLAAIDQQLALGNEIVEAIDEAIEQVLALQAHVGEVQRLASTGMVVSRITKGLPHDVRVSLVVALMEQRRLAREGK